ncbi:CsbD family protein [Thalassospira sp. MA62]|nr:CsbD family protein [Thalassospira sp. MA62]
MNWDQIEGRWKQLRGDIKTQWGRLTDDDIDAVEGQRDKLVGLIQEAYGVEREEADRQVRDYFDKL